MKLPHRRQFLHLAAGAAGLPALSRIASAQSYPSHPVRMIVPYPPGGAALPVKTLAEFATYAKTSAGKVSFASPGYGTSPHLIGETIKLISGADMVHIPYRGSAPAINDLLAGQVQMYAIDAGPIRPYIDAGRLRALAVASDTRSTTLPDVPTTAESGFPRLQATYAVGLFAPAGTPAAIVGRLNSATDDALRTPQVQDGLRSLGAQAYFGTAQDSAAHVAAIGKTLGDMVTAIGTKPQ